MDDTQQSRVSDAAATASRKRRSSILKSQRPPRTPFSELEFHITTPTDTAKSRRVSFSKRTGVAEFITNEATTTWKNFYEEHNKSLESSGNDSAAKAPRQTIGHLGKRLFDQQFEEVEAVDLLTTIDNQGIKNVNTSFQNVNFTQQLASFECTGGETNLLLPQKQFEMSAVTDHQSKVFCEDLAISAIGEMSGKIDINFSAMQSIGSKQFSDDLDEIQRDSQRALSNVVCTGPFGRNENSEYIEVDLNSTHFNFKNDVSDMSITDIIDCPKVQDDSKSISISVDKKSSFTTKNWVEDKENIGAYGTSALLVNQGTERRRTIIYEKDSENISITQAIPAAIITSGVSNKINASVLGDMSLTQDNNLSITQAIPRNIILPGTSNILPSDNLSMTEAISAKILSKSVLKTDFKVNISKDDVSLNQSTNIQIGETQYLKKNQESDITFKTAELTYNLPQKQFEIGADNDQQSKVFCEDRLISSIGEMPAVQSIRSKQFTDDLDEIQRDSQQAYRNVVCAGSFNKNKNSKYIEFDRNSTHISFKNNESEMSITDIIDCPKVQDDSKSIFITADKKSSFTTKPLMEDKENIGAYAASSLLVNQGTERRRTIVFENDLENISMTQVIPAVIITSGVSNKMNTSVSGDMSLTQDNNLSITQAIPRNIILPGTSSTLLSDNLSITEAVPAEILSKSVFKTDSKAADLSNDELGFYQSTNNKIVETQYLQKIHESDIANKAAELTCNLLPQKQYEMGAFKDQQNKVFCEDRPISTIGERSAVQSIASKQFNEELGEIQIDSLHVPCNVVCPGSLSRNENSEYIEIDRNRTHISIKNDEFEMSITDIIECPKVHDDFKSISISVGQKSSFITKDVVEDKENIGVYAASSPLVDQGIERRRTIVYENDSENISMTQVIPAVIMTSGISNNINTSVLGNMSLTQDNNLSITQAIPRNIILSRTSNVLSSDTLSMTEALPAKILSKSVFKTDSDADLSKDRIGLHQSTNNHIVETQYLTKIHDSDVNNKSAQLTCNLLPQNQFEKGAVNDHPSKVLCEELPISTIGEMSVVQSISSKQFCDDLDEIQRDSQRVLSNVCASSFSENKNAEYTDVDCKSTHISFKNDELDMSVTDTINSPKLQDVSKSVSISDDKKAFLITKNLTADKENIEAYNMTSQLVNQGTERRRTIAYENDSENISTTQVIPAAMITPGITNKINKTVSGNMSSTQDNNLSITQAIHKKSMLSGTLNTLPTDNLFIGEAVPAKILPNSVLTTDSKADASKDEISLHQSRSNLLVETQYLKKIDESHITDKSADLICNLLPPKQFEVSAVIDQQSKKCEGFAVSAIGETSGIINANFSAVQSIGSEHLRDDLDKIQRDSQRDSPSNIVCSRPFSRNKTSESIEVDLNSTNISSKNDESNMSVTDSINYPTLQDVSISGGKKSCFTTKDLIKDKENIGSQIVDQDTERRRTIVYEKHSENISTAEVIAVTIITSEGTNKIYSTVFGDMSLTKENNLSVTQAFPRNRTSNILPSDNMSIGETVSAKIPLKSVLTTDSKADVSMDEINLHRSASKQLIETQYLKKMDESHITNKSAELTYNVLPQYKYQVNADNDQQSKMFCEDFAVSATGRTSGKNYINFSAMRSNGSEQFSDGLDKIQRDSQQTLSNVVCADPFRGNLTAESIEVNLNSSHISSKNDESNMSVTDTINYPNVHDVSINDDKNSCFSTNNLIEDKENKTSIGTSSQLVDKDTERRRTIVYEKHSESISTNQVISAAPMTSGVTNKINSTVFGNMSFTQDNNLSITRGFSRNGTSNILPSDNISIGETDPAKILSKSVLTTDSKADVSMDEINLHRSASKQLIETQYLKKMDESHITNKSAELTYNVLPQYKYQVNADNDQQSKMFCEDFAVSATGRTSGKNYSNFSAMRSNGSEQFSDGLDKIQRDSQQALSNVVCADPFRGNLTAESIEVDLNSSHISSKNDESNMSVTDTINYPNVHDVSMNDDKNSCFSTNNLIEDKENKTSIGTSSQLVDQDTERRRTIVYEKHSESISTNQVISAAPMTSGVTNKINSTVFGNMSFTQDNNLSITRGFSRNGTSNILPSDNMSIGETDPAKILSKSVLTTEFNADVSNNEISLHKPTSNQVVETQYLKKIDESHITNQTAELACDPLPQKQFEVSAVIDQQRKVFCEDLAVTATGRMSEKMDIDFSAMQSIGTERRRTIVYEKHSENISTAQVIPATIITSEGTNKINSTVFGDMSLTQENNLSVTQAFPRNRTSNILPSDNMSIGETVPAKIPLKSVLTTDSKADVSMDEINLHRSASKQLIETQYLKKMDESHITNKSAELTYNVLPQYKYQVNADNDQQSKMFCEDFAVSATGRTSGKNYINFSAMRSNGSEQFSDGLDKIQRDSQRALSNVVCSDPFNRNEHSKTIEVDLNSTHISSKNDESEMSLTDSINCPKEQNDSKSISISVDKRSSLTTKKVEDNNSVGANGSNSPLVNQGTERERAIVYEKNTENISTTQDIPSATITSGVTNKINSTVFGDMSLTQENNLSVTQAFPRNRTSNILPSEVLSIGETVLVKTLSKSVLTTDSKADVSTDGISLHQATSRQDVETQYVKNIHESDSTTKTDELICNRKRKMADSDGAPEFIDGALKKNGFVEKSDHERTSTGTATHEPANASYNFDCTSSVASNDKNLTSDSNSVSVITKINMLPFMGTWECEWASRSANTWSFRLLHGRLRLTVRLATTAAGAEGVRADTPVAEVTLNVAHTDKKAVVGNACVGFAAEALQYLAGRGCGAARDVPALLRRGAAVARLASRWGRAMHEARLHLAYTLSAGGRLSLKVANVPLRSVWEVTLRMEMVVGDALEAPWPCATCVRVARVVSDVAVPPEEVRRATAGVPRDWGHVPRTVWKIFRYLKNKTRDKELFGL